MAATNSDDNKTANTAVKGGGDHDRVAMLSINASGVPDQHNPEIIGDVEFARDATRQQFAEQAVSAADVAAREASATDSGEVSQDPSIAKAKKEHEKIVSEAEKAADKVVDSLHQG